MDPYAAKPNQIPPEDPYSDLPLYGRYHPEPEDFKPLGQHCNSNSPESMKYWEDVLQKCDSTCYVYQNPFGGRDVFALGSVIIKSGHLRGGRDQETGPEATRDYSLTDANEAAAIQIVSQAITTPRILFLGKINGNDILVQSRIPGVGLNVAWPYLSAQQKSSFKDQAREILYKLKTMRPPPEIRVPSYIVPDPNPIANRDIDPAEYELLFDNPKGSQVSTRALSLMHNDLQPSNIIVKDDQIVGVVDWEQAGWFPWESVAAVHSPFRVPSRENFSQANLSNTKVDDLVFWGDLYER